MCGRVRDCREVRGRGKSRTRSGLVLHGRLLVALSRLPRTTINLLYTMNWQWSSKDVWLVLLLSIACAGLWRALIGPFPKMIVACVLLSSDISAEYAASVTGGSALLQHMPVPSGAEVRMSLLVLVRAV